MEKLALPGVEPGHGHRLASRRADAHDAAITTEQNHTVLIPGAAIPEPSFANRCHRTALQVDFLQLPAAVEGYETAIPRPEGGGKGEGVRQSVRGIDFFNRHCQFADLRLGKEVAHEHFHTRGGAAQVIHVSPASRSSRPACHTARSSE
jgi:hypothetical protein